MGAVPLYVVPAASGGGDLTQEDPAMEFLIWWKRDWPAKPWNGTTSRQWSAQSIRLPLKRTASAWKKGNRFYDRHNFAWFRRRPIFWSC